MKNLKGLRSCIKVLGFVSAIIVKFASFVEGGIFRVIENIINFCQAETADLFRRGKRFCKCQDLPFYFVIEVLIFQIPDVGAESC